MITPTWAFVDQRRKIRQLFYQRVKANVNKEMCHILMHTVQIASLNFRCGKIVWYFHAAGKEQNIIVL